jgi:hypothetical protein
MSYSSSERPQQDRDGDIKGLSPTQLRIFDRDRLDHIDRLENENATLRAQVIALQARLAAHDEAVRMVKELGDTPWVAAARKKV